MTYNEARLLMAKCRDKSKGKPIQNNTRLFERGDAESTYYVIRLHNTDIIEIYSNHTYGLRHDGWTTVTTRDRIYGWSPLGWQQLQSEGGNGGDWFLRARANASDPEPPSNNHIEVDKPYAEPPVAGREPVESDFGQCWVGHRHSYTHRVTKLAEPGEHISRGTQYAPYDGWEDQPTAARRVLAYLPSLRFSHSVRISYLETVVVDYGEESYAYGRSARTKYEQCPHCKAFQSAHRAWTVRKLHRAKWDLNINTYGSYDAWRSAWRDDRQRVIQANREWRAWNERNRIPWDGLVIVNSDGWPLWSEVKAVRKAQAARKRAERAERRRREEQEKHERQLARWKGKYDRARAQRKPGFTEQVAQLAATVSEISAGLDLTVSVNDSQENEA